MKNPTFILRRGFTLVELLVVIAIIAILAASGFVAGTLAMKKANKTKALAMCAELELGVNNFYTDYNTLPTSASEDEQLKTNDATGVDLLEILMAREDEGGAVINTKGIRYIEPKEGKGNKNGVIYGSGGSTVEGLFDPWGGPYNIMLDADYDEQLDVQPKGSSVIKALNGRRVAAWSDGPDGFDNGMTGKAVDDVITW